MYEMTDTQFQTVYKILSFALASMMATTIFLWMRATSIHEDYKSAVLISGLVTFIAAYHYMRIFNSWDSSYAYSLEHEDPKLTGLPFNDAYRYMDWLLTVPLLLMEIVLIMHLEPAEVSDYSMKLGVSSAIMIIAGYPGELITEQSQLGQRWMYWGMSMVPFCYVVYTLLVGLSDATSKEQDPDIKSKVKMAQLVTVLSWLTYPIVYVIPMFGFSGASTVVGIQVGYCISDIISKCGVGLIIYQITAAKSLDVPRLRRIASKFAEFDKDGSGFIDGTESIMLVEWVLLCKSTKLSPQKCKGFAAKFSARELKKIDTDHDGRVSIDEFMALYNELVARHPELRGNSLTLL